MSEFNSFLILPSCEAAKGGGRYIEEPTRVENIVFQTRPGALTAFEDRFADALMSVFAEGHDELESVAAGLNSKGSTDPQGASWSADSLARILSVLGKAVFATVEEERVRG
ncbi:recombinase-like helix-turn-helix domain-containing protein [Sphingobium sp. TCM1]|uniref:recombinase-like helix-turn-helix domain-containing protein n=1 Tax=Sphingobium sp. TCM1 TaxID=453246 RepID=UPI0007F435D4|nr:recombinase-like helix-turn-helix domain-containing protein [Sphingobium sp. TCM1]OAN56536.1 hypothetical protein A7Q26_18280 [Sphingobium sp. TCM1]